MALVPCVECNREIGSTVVSCPGCGTNQIEFRKIVDGTSVNDPNKYNWWAFFFWNQYYAGHGKLGKAVLMSIIGFIPITMIFVAMYCGRKANRELPVGKVKFSWIKAILIFLLNGFITLSIISYVDSKNKNNIQASTQETNLSDQSTTSSNEKNNDIVQEAKKFIQDITQDPKEILTVKNGKLNNYPKKTIGEAVNSFFGDPSWESIKSGDGNDYVNVSGNISYMQKQVKAVMQFKLIKNSDDFEVKALEINELPQNNLMIIGLLEKMYEESDIKGSSSNQSDTINDSNQEGQNNIRNNDYEESNSNQGDTLNKISFDRTLFQGTINNKIKIHMNFSIKDGEIKGTYYYDVYKKNIEIIGNIDDENNFVFNEIDPNDSHKIIGSFRGLISDINLISGTWMNQDGSTEYPFTINKL